MPVSRMPGNITMASTENRIQQIAHNTNSFHVKFAFYEINLTKTLPWYSLSYFCPLKITVWHKSILYDHCCQLICHKWGSVAHVDKKKKKEQQQHNQTDSALYHYNVSFVISLSFVYPSSNMYISNLVFYSKSTIMVISGQQHVWEFNKSLLCKITTTTANKQTQNSNKQKQNKHKNNNKKQ